MKNLLFLWPSVLFVSGCAATLTPSGDIYTELLAPTSTVIVEERPVVVAAASPVIMPAPRPVVVSAPRPKPAHPRVKPQPRPRGFHTHPDRYAKNTTPRPTSGASRPGNPSRPPNGHHAR